MKKYVILIGAGVLVVGGVLIIFHYFSGCKSYAFINTDFACGNNIAISKGSYEKLDNDIEKYIEQQQALGAIESVSVNFRDLRGGPTMGRKENTHFAPASLLKLPTIMAYLAYAEEHPSLLKQKIKYESGEVSYVNELTQLEVPNAPLVVGQEYSIEELMQSTLAYSDNLAFFLLINNFIKNVPDGSEWMKQAFSDLGIVDPRDPEEESVTVRNYSGLYRQLYNVSFLNAEDSEKVLTWLSQSTFTKGLVAGVGEGTKIAHKFGERGLEDGTEQLHDCGIVYFPENPYILCVMTRGKDWAAMAQVIKTVSNMVWNEVNARKL